MNANGFDLQFLLAMRHSPIRNYIVPGLTSWLIGEKSEYGLMRLFECSREHREHITPHSHRFDFQCWVLRGHVINQIWQQSHDSSAADFFMESALVYNGEIGSYEQMPEQARRWKPSETKYAAGECYSMKAHEVHSIYFSRGALVLFFEGPQKTDETKILEPWVDGFTVPTFETKSWMFRRDGESQ